MKRFIRTLFVKRVAQITVVHDSDASEFVVLRWRAASGQTVERLKAFPYEPGRSSVGKDEAIGYMKTVHEAELAASVSLCPWCPGFDKTDPKLAGATTKMCDPCRQRESRKLDELEAKR